MSLPRTKYWPAARRALSLSPASHHFNAERTDVSPELYQRMLPVFLDEAEAKLGDVRDAIVTLASNPAAPGARQKLARATHTLRGNAGMLGLRAVVDACVRLERRWPLNHDAVQPRPGDLAALDTWYVAMQRLLDAIATDFAPALAGATPEGDTTV